MKRANGHRLLHQHPYSWAVAGFFAAAIEAGAHAAVPILLRTATIVFCVAASISFAQTSIQISIDEGVAGANCDLTPYSLGQGGLSSKLVFHGQISRLREINPRTIRFFIQEYYNLYPAHNTYHWASLDSTLDDIVATGDRRCSYRYRQGACRSLPSRQCTA